MTEKKLLQAQNIPGRKNLKRSAFEEKTAQKYSLTENFNRNIQLTIYMIQIQD